MLQMILMQFDMPLGQGIIMLIDSIFLTILTIIMMVKTTTLKLTIIALFTLTLYYYYS